MNASQIRSIVERRALPGAAQDVRLLETHISWVILTGDLVYKIKKPIQYSFLDFSTQEKRRYFCLRELQLNRRLTDHLYLRVIPIREEPPGPAIGGIAGKVIDHALVMHRLDEERQMDRMLRRGEVTRAHVWQIARRLSDFHSHATVTPGAENTTLLQARFEDLISVQPFLSGAVGSAAAAKVDEVVGYARRFLESHAGRLRRRNQLGWVVDGHGDLHSRNIFLLAEPVIFDCIEFNDSFRRLDMLNELAFFCMDLEYHGHDHLASAFLSDYLNRLPCMETEADHQLFCFYKLYRANVRLKVNCLRAMQPESETQFLQTMSAVGEYLGLVDRYFSELSEKTDTRRHVP